MDPAAPPISPPRSRLAVVYGHRSLDVMQIREGARGWCDLIWLVDPDDPSVVSVGPLLRRFGTVVEALTETPEAAAAALAAHRPQGLVTFYDHRMEHVAAIAAALGVPFHSPHAGRCLADKHFQREALRAAGLPTPATAVLGPGADRATVQALGAGLRYPAVLKPRRASGSWHTFPVADVDALGGLWDELSDAEPEDMLLEEYLADGPPMPGGFEAGYVSVETIAHAGELTHLAITGRFPLVAPFRETGFFIPATVGAERHGELLDLADHALRAVGFTVGAAHTEIKLTPTGGQVIEINGRIGGGVPEMLALAAGVDIVRLTMEAALGRIDGLVAMPATTGVAYRFFFQPPAQARRLTSLEGLDELRALPGVQSITLHHPPGTELDARHGTRTYLFAVVGHAPDHAGMVEIDTFLRTRIRVGYEFASPAPEDDAGDESPAARRARPSATA